MIECAPCDTVDDLIGEVLSRSEKGERSLVTTLTKKMAEDLTEYLDSRGVKVKYIHHSVETMERTELLRSLRAGVYDVLVGINLLREGIDLPEVTLVAILDADKEGLFRSETSLIQMIGRAARNADGRVIMYADTVTKSMEAAIGETARRRTIPGGVQPRARHNPEDDRQGDRGTDTHRRPGEGLEEETRREGSLHDEGRAERADRSAAA